MDVYGNIDCTLQSILLQSFFLLKMLSKSAPLLGEHPFNNGQQS